MTLPEIREKIEELQDQLGFLDEKHPEDRLERRVILKKLDSLTEEKRIVQQDISAIDKVMKISHKYDVDQELFEQCWDFYQYLKYNKKRR